MFPISYTLLIERPAWQVPCKVKLSNEKSGGAWWFCTSPTPLPHGKTHLTVLQETSSDDQTFNRIAPASVLSFAFLGHQ